ncbi:hypothetical protein ZIOFF_050010 [Zingiber officinale]|uniref:Uncharacterized protein n=1 Tax=Zingiber officinale TaxID=94328 RepID=A0A8J5KLQ8_ZINOF|nr:hypothetical protein ZIOFF_050010 [Zingiber officinale]
MKQRRLLSSSLPSPPSPNPLLSRRSSSLSRAALLSSRRSSSRSRAALLLVAKQSCFALLSSSRSRAASLSHRSSSRSRAALLSSSRSSLAARPLSRSRDPSSHSLAADLLRH